MVENNSADNIFERTLCHGTLQVSGIYQNSSYVICIYIQICLFGVLYKYIDYFQIGKNYK